MKKANQEEEERNSTHGSTSGSDSPGPHSNSSCVSDDQGLEGHSTDPPRENGDISSTAPHSYSSRRKYCNLAQKLWFFATCVCIMYVHREWYSHYKFFLPI